MRNGARRQAARELVRRGARVLALSCFMTGDVLGGLNDTGIVTFVNASNHLLRREPTDHPGQDARHGRDAVARAGKLTKTGGGTKSFDFTKLDAAGKELPANAKVWVCVRDNVTGLIWEAKTGDGGLRDKEHSYSWYNPDPTTNGGLAGERHRGTCTGSRCDTQAYVEAVNGLGLCGFRNWRLPTLVELRSLVDYGKASRNGPPTIDETHFVNMPLKEAMRGPGTPEDPRRINHYLGDNKWYWTSHPTAGVPHHAWRVTFRDGNDGLGDKGNPVHVMLVRGAK